MLVRTCQSLWDMMFFSVGWNLCVLLQWSESLHTIPARPPLCVVSPEAFCWHLLCLHLLVNATGEMPPGTTSSPQVGTVSLQAVASHQSAFLLQPGRLCYQDNEPCVVQAAASCPASIKK